MYNALEMLREIQGPVFTAFDVQQLGGGVERAVGLQLLFPKELIKEKPFHAQVALRDYWADVLDTLRGEIIDKLGDEEMGVLREVARNAMHIAYARRELLLIQGQKTNTLEKDTELLVKSFGMHEPARLRGLGRIGEQVNALEATRFYESVYRMHLFSTPINESYTSEQLETLLVETGGIPQVSARDV